MPHQADTACDLSTPRKPLFSELIPPEPTHSYHLLLSLLRHRFCKLRDSCRTLFHGGIVFAPTRGAVALGPVIQGLLGRRYLRLLASPNL